MIHWQKDTVPRTEWLDTLRILASFLVILSHYAYFFLNTAQHNFGYHMAGSTGRLGVALFFAISGYLACHSLDRIRYFTMLAVGRFYYKKLVRILIPWWAAMFVMGGLVVVLSLMNRQFLQISTLAITIFAGVRYDKLFISFFPLDVSLSSFFPWSGYFFIGEWFIGTVLWLYSLSPILYFAARRYSIGGLIATILISIVSCKLLYGQVSDGFCFFTARIPEFLLGMILFHQRNLFSQWKKAILPAAAGIVLLVGGYDTLHYTPGALWVESYLPLKPRSFFLSLPLIILFFYGMQWINKKGTLHRLNQFSKISYVFMLIQHIMLFIFMNNMDYGRFSKFGILFVFVVIVVCTAYVSLFIYSLYKPVETWLIDRGREKE